MSLQPDADTKVDRTSTAPFLLRLFWRENRQLESYEFSVAPPTDSSGISDYSSLLPSSIRQQSVQIYTWPTCTLAELTGLLTSVLPSEVLPSPASGTRLVYKLIFPDTRANTSASGKGKWIEKQLGSVVIGGRGDVDMEDEGRGVVLDDLEGDAYKTLAEAKFVIGDYVACSIYPPGPDGRPVPPPPQASRPPRDGPRGPPRENGYGRSGPSGYRGGYGGGGGGYRGGGYGGYGNDGYGSGGGYGGRGGGFNGGAPPPGDWRRGERPPPPDSYGGGGYGRRGVRPY